MNVNEAVTIADRLSEVIDYARRCNVSRQGLENEILDVIDQLLKQADDLDNAMYEEMASAYEKYDEAMYNNLRADADAYNARRGV
jgi:hypothetical protein